ncbi:MAG: TssQ family T6SS-associated lipoprotein [Advenella sp.]|uniref:TssQ family T6SS-associated lipoprotein n=1 Tax=Advenella alkanexedens TaxID=1481665 RepID=UPI001699ADB2|nr:TssQ family T6SS-associated lipoprotein [Advenella alkanexedens]MDY0273222.1 TssQ family T6SS-associated lipoprotein [Advenella sp.]NLN67725.1 TssQ family T6SS-associated lipoprotein [Alcaligenaceae bacterium]NLY33619.1 TssQ family T6SS-associated lipoprotein [Alcaligenaceae bacterium]WKU19531.1 TssQ family T6SS-associated lipoprotein [Advenella alkanexedens]
MSKKFYTRTIGTVIAGLLLGACSSTPKAPPSPYSSEEEQVLQALESSFSNGAYKELIKNIKAEPLMLSGSLAFRSEALKYQAFSQCLTRARTACGKTFNQLLAANPDYQLTEAESTHPTWGPVFEKENKKVQATRLRIQQQMPVKK